MPEGLPPSSRSHSPWQSTHLSRPARSGGKGRGRATRGIGVLPMAQTHSGRHTSGRRWAAHCRPDGPTPQAAAAVARFCERRHIVAAALPGPWLQACEPPARLGPRGPPRCPFSRPTHVAVGAAGGRPLQVARAARLGRLAVEPAGPGGALPAGADRPYLGAAGKASVRVRLRCRGQVMGAV